MTFFALTGILTFLTNLSLGLLVYFKNPKNKMNRVYLMFAVSTGIWGLGAWKIGTIPEGEKELAFLWWRIAHFGIIFIPVFFTHFVYIWLEIKRKFVLFLVYLQGIMFLSMNIFDMISGSSPGLFVQGTTWVHNSFYWDTHYKPDLYWLYLFIWVFLVLYSHYELFRVYKISSGIKRAQIKYFFLGAAIGYSGGTTCYLNVFGINVYPYLNFTVALYPLFTSYAIIKSRFMDIRIILGRIGIYALSAGIVVLYVLFVSYWNDNLKLVSSSIYGSFVALTVIPLFYYISQSLEKLASKYFYYTIYSLKQTIERLLKELNQTIEMNKLIGLISSSLLDSLKLERIGIILKEPREKTFRVQSAITSKKEELLALIKTEDGFLFQYLQEKEEALVREEIPYIIKQEETKIRDVQQKEVFKQKKQKLEIIKKELDKLEMGLVLPLLIEKKLIGIIILGNKLSGEAYTIQDFNLLSILSAQSSIAINNALSYEEIEIRKAELEKFYKLTVGRELRMRELKERIRNLEGKLEKT